ncbi:hypothetical protein Pint_16700 [Pistacia integerrima]|uniref:Uncharacterized protein n=1 Tax=Pistacia integerrima TaxID=434235 RepID=A0ACC0ZCA6_9ROSI|nr:hypothetical protein Pint_16700 [Pistacia integerrima]
MMVDMQPQLSNELIKIMEQKLLAIERRSACLENLINRPEASPTEYSKANKELRKMRGSMKLINELRTKQKEIDGLKSLMTECPEDKDLPDMATDELNQAIGSSIEKSECSKLSAGVSRPLAVVECEVVISLAVESSCLVKVVFGFCLSGLLSLSTAKVVRMHPVTDESVVGISEQAVKMPLCLQWTYLRCKFLQPELKKGWKFDVIDVTESDLRGYKEASAAISGAGVYGKLKFESGIHSVQVDVQLRNEDLMIDTYRSGGSGGQHANTTNSAVRITHIPTGMTVSIQDQTISTYAKALKLLCAKLYEMERTMKRSYHCRQIGSGDRSELIRTYNFPQGRVMDRCVSITHHAINDVMQGENIDIFIDALLLQQEMDAIASFSSSQ